MATWPKERRVIGKKHQRLDGPAKATGRAEYSFDVNRKGMLHAVIVRCPHAHAIIKGLDLDVARKAPGVKAIYVVGATMDGVVAKVDGETITVKTKQGGKEVERTVKPGAGVAVLKSGKEELPGNLKAGDPVTIYSEQDAVGRELFYAGEEIVGIAADTEEHARDAARLVGHKITYQVLDFLVNEDEALKQDRQTAPLQGGSRNNVRVVQEQTSGNLEEGFRMADAVVEGEYGAATICHQCLESHGLVAEWKDDNLTVWASTQAVAGTAGELARVFAVPPGQVKCLTRYMGGGFGSKFGPDIQGIVAAHLARRAGAAVKLMLDREEEVTVGGTRPSAYAKVKIGGTKDGTITAYDVDSWGSPGVGNSSTVGPLPYVYPIANAKRKHTMIRLNAASLRAMRAPGHPQSCLLTDCPVDDLAAALGLDPMQVRLKNIPPNDPAAAAKDPTGFNHVRHTVYTEEIKKAAELANWEKLWHPPGKGPGDGPVKHGIGMALHTWGGQGFAGQQTRVTISSDGSVLVQGSTQDLGTGQRTVLAIVAAEVFGLEPKDITIDIGDSAYGPSGGSGGSTTCPSQAPSILNSSTKALEALFEKIAPRLNAKKEDLAIEAGHVVDKPNGKKWAWKEACAKLGMDKITETADWTRGLSSVNVGGVQVAEVKVDTETGVVRCTKMVAVQDCGMVVNKLCCTSQVAGGVIMGVNYALFEERIMDRHTGRQVNADMEFYKLGGIKDMPEVIVHLHDMPERGVIGVGEPPTISTAAAVGNAIFNAIGVRVPFAPYTPDRVLAALAKKGGKG